MFNFLFNRVKEAITPRPMPLPVVAPLDLSYTLMPGKHLDPARGRCAMEWVSWLEGNEHSDQPKTVDPVIRTVAVGLNDNLSDRDRQLLKPYLARAIGTFNDGHGKDRQLAVAERGAAMGLPYIFATQPREVAKRILQTQGTRAALEFFDSLLLKEEINMDLVAPTRQETAEEVFA